MVPIRSWIATLIFVLAVVPTIVRVNQTVDASRSARPSFSFRKSVDVPPDRVVLIPDLNTRMAWAQTVPLVPQVVVRRHHEDEMLPTAPAPVDTAGLRAPPASLV